MIGQIAYYSFLGFPLIMWGGFFTFLCLIATALIAILTVKNIKPLPLKWHTNLAIITIILASLHGLAAILSRLGL